MDKSYSLTLFRTFSNKKTEERFWLSKFSGHQYSQLIILAQILTLVDASIQGILNYKQILSLVPLMIQILIKLKRKRNTRNQILWRILASVFHILNLNRRNFRSGQITFYLMGSIFYSSCLIPDVVLTFLFVMIEAIFLAMMPNYKIYYTFVFGLPCYIVYLMISEHRRQAFAIMDYYSKEDTCHHILEQSFQVPLLLLDQQRNILHKNDAVKEILPDSVQNLDEVISDASVKEITETMTRYLQSGQPITLQLKHSVHDDQASLYNQLEFFIKEIHLRGKRIYSLNALDFYPITQSTQTKIQLIEQMVQASDHLYTQVCQDYQTKNNLRTLAVLREKDLENIGKCAADCLQLKYKIWTQQALLNDDLQRGLFNLGDLHIKNFIINTFDGFSLKILEKLSSLQVQFEESFPDILYGDKDNFVFVIWAILTCLSQDTLSKKYDLTFKSSVHKLQMDKNGYILQFSFSFKCTGNMAQIFQSAISGNSALSIKPIGTPLPHQEQTSDQAFLTYLLTTVKNIIRSQGLSISFDYAETQQTPGINPQNTSSQRLEETFRRILQFQYSFKVPRRRDQKKDMKDEQKLRESIRNIGQIDLTFSKTVNKNVVYWRPKEVAPRMTLSALLKRNEQEEVKSEIVPNSNLLKLESLAIEEREDDDSQTSKSSNVSIDLTPVHRFNIVENGFLLPNIEDISDELRNELQSILQEIIKQTLYKSQFENIDIEISEDASDAIQNFSGMQDGDSQNNFPSESSPKRGLNYYTVPQIREENQPKNSPQLTEGSERHRQLHNQRMREQQLKLLSPQVIKRFSSQNLRRMGTGRKRSQAQHTQEYSKSISEVSSQLNSNQSSLRDVFLPAQVIDARLLTHHRLWTYNVDIDRAAVKYNKTILFFYVNSRQSYFGEKFKTFLEVDLQPIKDIHDILRCYQQELMNSGQLYHMILISLETNLRKDVIEIVQAIRKIEKNTGLPSTFITGMTDHNQSVTLTLQQIIPMIIKTPVDNLQVEKLKVRLNALHSN